MRWRSFIRTLIGFYSPVLVVLLLGAVLTMLGSASLRQQYRAADQARFDRAFGQTVETIQDRMRHYGLVAISLADFFAARDSISQPEWRFRIQTLSLEQNYPGLLEVGFASLRPGRPESSSGTNDLDHDLPDSPSGISFQVLHAWARPPSAMGGVDPEFLAEPAQSAAAWQAITNASVTLGGMRQLSAEVEGEPARGFSIFVPVFRGTAQSGTNITGSAIREDGAPRTQQARGIGFCSIEPELLLGALFGLAPREIGFELFSSPTASDLDWLNRSGKTPRALDPSFRAYIRTNLSFQVINQTWAVHCYTTPLFEREAALSRMWLVQPLGLALTLALSGLLAIQIRARIRQGAVAEELRSACDELQNAQNERERVSRELHDGAIQSLYLLQLTLGRCERLFRSDTSQALTILVQAKSGVDDLISELRRFLLREDVVTEKSVTFQDAHAQLQTLVRRFGNARTLRIQLAANSSAPVFLTSTQLGHMKRIAQEAISNSLRHSHARTLQVDLRATDTVVRLVIADDGWGFEPQGAAGTGNGLANMQARAAHLGGTFEVKSGTGLGTSATLVFPANSTSGMHHEQTHPD